MKISIKTKEKGTITANTAVSFMFEEETLSGDVSGKCGAVSFFPKRSSDDARQEEVIVGLGKPESLTLEKWKKAIASVVIFLQGKKRSAFALDVPTQALRAVSFEHGVRALVVALYTGSYQFGTYISDTSRLVAPIERIELVFEDGADKKLLTTLVREGEVIGRSVNFTRDLGNMPPIDMTPSYLAEEAVKLAKKHKMLKATVFGRDRIRKEGMGGLLSVSLGSDQEPKFIVLEWMNGPKKAETHVFAGKAITFDSGGISIKPSEGLEEMKFDMLGGAAVLGAMRAIAELGLKVNVVGLIAATENLVGGSAYRPGDIIRAKNGKTIEIVNTDAEGRLVLADALSYASRYKPRAVVDVATLTGACMVALGSNYAGLFARDRAGIADVYMAAGASGERFWELPLDDEFSEEVQSDVADVRNLGRSRYGGASSAAAFLEHFTDYPWVHMDIAGTAWGKASAHTRTGATGFGVQTLLELARRWEK